MSKKGLENFEGESVLISGGAGFIGSHLVDKLNALGSKVYVVDNFSSAHDNYQFPKEVSVDVIDIRHAEKVRKCISSIKPRMIFHMAAYSRTQGSDDKELVYSTNIIGTANLIDSVDENITSSFIYSGSSTYYGSGNVPNKETDLPDFGTHYAMSKYAGEEVLKIIARKRNISHAILRYFSVYGERQPEDGAYALVLGIFLRRARLGLSLQIHGDGTQRRDFVHVEDVVHANILTALTEGVDSKVLNIGVGQNYSILELAKMISTNLEFVESRVGDASETLADIENLKNTLNWSPKNRLIKYIEKSIAKVKQ